MKTFFVAKIALMSAVLFSIAVSAPIVAPIPAYPSISITPASPKANTDSVSLFLRLGSSPNSCSMPYSYDNEKFTIQQSPLAIYPPVFTITLSYMQLVNTPHVCPDIYDPVDYGPTFGLGKLALGTYNVTDGNTKKQVGSFSFVNVEKPLGDTVSVTPGKPTVKDSLHFDLYTLLWDCCTQYYKKTVSVSDTMIVLSFEYSDINTCECIVAGSHAAFACGPQKAGKYAVYKAPALYCAAPPCPLGVIRMTRVGEVVISPSTEIISPVNSVVSTGFSCVATGNSIKVNCRLSRAGLVSVAVCNAAGMLISRLASGALNAGPHGFAWTAASPGAYFIEVRYNGAAVMTQKIVVPR